MRKCLFLLVLLNANLRSQVVDSGKFKNAYLKDHSSVLNKNNFHSLLTNWKQYKVILYGEVHDQKKSDKNYIYLLQYFFENDTNSHLLLESSPSEEFFFENYIENNSTKIFFKGDYFQIIARNEEKNYYSPIRDLFIKPRMSAKSKIHSIDLERHFYVSILALGVILDRNREILNLHLLSQMDSVPDHLETNNSSLYSICDLFISDFIVDSSQYKNHLSLRDYSYYSRIIFALQSGQEFDRRRRMSDMTNKQRAAELREEFMFNNLITLLTQYPNAHFIGEFGLTHVVVKQSTWEGMTNWVSLAERINQKLPNSICRIVNYYTDINPFGKETIINDSDWKFYKQNSRKWRSTIFDMREEKDLFNCSYNFVIVNR